MIERAGVEGDCNIVAQPQIAAKTGAKTDQDWLADKSTGGFVQCIEGEIVVADADDDTIQVYVLRAGKYALLGKFAADGTFDSPVWGTFVDLKPGFANVPPKPF